MRYENWEEKKGALRKAVKTTLPPFGRQKEALGRQRRTGEDEAGEDGGREDDAGENDASEDEAGEDKGK